MISHRALFVNSSKMCQVFRLYALLLVAANGPDAVFSLSSPCMLCLLVPEVSVIIRATVNHLLLYLLSSNWGPLVSTCMVSSHAHAEIVLSPISCSSSLTDLRLQSRHTSMTRRLTSANANKTNSLYCYIHLYL